MQDIIAAKGQVQQFDRMQALQSWKIPEVSAGYSRPSTTNKKKRGSFLWESHLTDRLMSNNNELLFNADNRRSNISLSLFLVPQSGFQLRSLRQFLLAPGLKTEGFLKVLEQNREPRLCAFNKSILMLMTLPWLPTLVESHTWVSIVCTVCIIAFNYI